MGQVDPVGAEVGDPDPVRPAGLDPGLHRRTRVVDMDVDVPEPVPADHDERVTEPVEPGAQPVDRAVPGLQQIDHLEGGAVLRSARRAVLGRGSGHGGDVGGHPDAVFGRLPGDRFDEGLEDGHQTPSSGVHDARPPEDGQLSGGLVQRSACPLVRGLHDRLRTRVARRAPGGLGGRGGHRQHGALDGVGDGLPGRGRGPGQREPQMVRVVPVGQHPRHAAQQLRQDRAGVPAGADQRPVRHGPYGIGEGGHGRAGLVPGEDRFDGSCRGLHRQIEVGPGVPVRDGIDIDRVDRRTLPAQCFQGQRAPGTHRDGVHVVGGLRHVVFLLESGRRRPAEPQSSPVRWARQGQGRGGRRRNPW